jgi:hypothetical protein
MNIVYAYKDRKDSTKYLRKKQEKTRVLRI